MFTKVAVIECSVCGRLFPQQFKEFKCDLAYCDGVLFEVYKSPLEIEEYSQGERKNGFHKTSLSS